MPLCQFVRCPVALGVLNIYLFHIQKGKIWVNNGIQEFMVEKNNIPEGFSKGRLKSKCFNGGKTRGDVKGTIWWNNGQVEKMSKNKPDDSFVKGRLKKS